MRLLVALILLLLPANVAHAAWLEASSAHFVVYADDSERDIHRFSEQLERYHSAMALVTGTKMEAPSPSNRVTVYVVRSDRDVRKLYRGDSKYVQGFYQPRAGGSLAIVPRVQVGSGEASYTMTILLHEYAHHFAASNSRFPMPRWLSEGGAEFFAAASFERDGSVGLGRPAQMRANELFYGRNVTAEQLLDPTTYAESKNYDAFYGKSWLLYHYLSLGRERDGQLLEYVRLLIAGKSQRDAGLGAFGDFDKLEKDLDDYLDRRKMVYLKLPPKLLETGPITVRALSEGEAAMMPVKIRSKRGVTPEEAAELVEEARAVAARYPKDAAVLSALAEAEFDSGNSDRAIAAADAALAIDPRQTNAYVQKGYAMFDLADQADDTAAAYTRARVPFLKLNKLENDHPLPLVYNYRFYVEQGEDPPELAVQGLARASELAPFDLGLRMTLAMKQLQLGQMAEARRNLIPIAFNPHEGGPSGFAQRILEKLDREPRWDGKSGLEQMAGGDEETSDED